MLTIWLGKNRRSDEQQEGQELSGGRNDSGEQGEQ